MKKLLMLGLLGLAGTAQAVKWEYGILYSAQGYMEWQNPKGVATAETLTGVMTKVGCKPKAGKSANYIDFLNCIGPSGWELVSVTATGEEERYFFKRVAQ